jgi:hypothetical protein
MKTALKYWFGLLLIILAWSTFLVSCKAKQPLQNTTVETNDKETVTDTKETILINQAILDKMLFNIAQINSTNPDCDSLINHYRHELARSIAASKQSGDNSYELKYNEALKRLEFIAKIGATQNKTLLKNTNTKTTYTLQKTVEVPLHFMKWWEKMFMRIGQICSGLALIFLAAFFIRSKIRI